MAPTNRATGDEFFTAEQIERLTDLMSRWRVARDAGTPFPVGAQAELEGLILAELRGATARAQQLPEAQERGGG